jgi:hypothetical protein
MCIRLSPTKLMANRASATASLTTPAAAAVASAAPGRLLQTNAIHSRDHGARLSARPVARGSLPPQVICG